MRYPLRRSTAIRADFLAYNQRTADAHALLDQVLREDPNNVLAHETMGLLEFRAQHLEQARNWYAQAVKLDSQSYLAHYYFAAISMDRHSRCVGGESSREQLASQHQAESQIRAEL